MKVAADAIVSRVLSGDYEIDTVAGSDTNINTHNNHAERVAERHAPHGDIHVSLFK